MKLDFTAIATAASNAGLELAHALHFLAHLVTELTPVATAVEAVVAFEAIPLTTTIGAVAKGVDTAMEAKASKDTVAPLLVTK